MSTDFNRIAGLYDSISSFFFGKKLIKAASYHLDIIPPNSRILIVGGGTGSILTKLIEKSDPSNILFLDKSEAMVKLSSIKVHKLKLLQCTKIEFRIGTPDHLRPEEMFDVIITHYFLDLFEQDELYQIMKKLYHHLKPGGYWLFADFRITKHPFHRIWQQLLIKFMYVFFNIITGLKTTRLEKFDDYFTLLNLNILDEMLFFKRMIYSRVYLK